MAISVLNTTSDLSGKTLVTAEGDRTLTGLLSYSRGGGAPFAVNVGAGLVANLDADKVDGVDFGTMAANRVPYGSSATAMTNNANFTFDGTTLTVPALGVTTAGINFPAVQQVSALANTLDDYEEGNWTPTDGSGAGLTLTYPTTSSYIKIGQLVIATWSVVYPVTASGAVVGINLPFTSMAGAQWNAGAFYSTFATPFTGLVNAASTVMTFFTAGGAGITNANFSGKDVRGTAVYRAST